MNSVPPSASPAENATVNGLICPSCSKAIDGEPNFCPACGSDLRGLGGASDTLSGPMNQLIDGRYQVLEKLGEGGMGSVYKVEHARMGKIAALKLMRPDAAVDKALKARFLQEARVVAKLSHPNTVQVFDSGELEDGSLYIAMEFVPGKDLAWHLKALGPLSEEKAISVAIQVLASLQEAHELGIIHRDIKPANIMLRRRKSGDDQVKLLDFGIAKLQEAEGRKTTTGDFVGTPAYMSPEQIRGEGIDARSDLYSLGAVLFELVTARQMYDGPTPISVITQHTDAAIPRVIDRRADAHVTPQFEQILHCALAKRADERYRDAEAMRAALEALRRDLGAISQPFTPIPREQDEMLSRADFDRYERNLRIRQTATPLLALGVVLALAVGGWFLLAHRSALEAATRLQEVEPNDSPALATPIAQGTDVTGAINARPNGEADRDLYVADLTEGGAFRVTLSGVPDLNLTLEVLQVEKTEGGDKLRRRLFLDDDGPSEPERVDALALEKGQVYLRVEERPFCTEPNRPPREKSLVPYTLRLERLAVPGVVEAEPNDTEAAAQALPLTKPVTAFLGRRIEDLDKLAAMRLDAPFSSPDWFRVEVPADETVFVAVVPPERGALLVVDGASLDSAKRKGARGFTVRGGPSLIELKAGPQGARRFRVMAGEDTLPGASYRVVAASTQDNGLAGLIELARVLADENQQTTRRQLLDQALKAFERSPEASRLAALRNE